MPRDGQSRKKRVVVKGVDPGAARCDESHHYFGVNRGEKVPGTYIQKNGKLPSVQGCESAAYCCCHVCSWGRGTLV